MAHCVCYCYYYYYAHLTARSKWLESWCIMSLEGAFSVCDESSDFALFETKDT
jgi:hypothetical protein